MLEDQVTYLLQKYLGNYVRGLSKEALKISVWKGDVELTNMQLKPEALNALKLPVKVKAGFLGSVRLKVPWSRLGQEPVLVYLDRIFILADPATQVEGCTEDSLQEAKRNRVREMEMRLLESWQQQKSEMNTSWLGSLINTIIGNLKLSITNIHIRYEDPESNPGHPFAAGLTLKKLSAVTVDDEGKETFVTGGSPERIQKSVELDRLALYFDSDLQPLKVDKPWEDLFPSEWSQIFEFGSSDGSPDDLPKKHSYILQPVSGYAKYEKMRFDESRSMEQPLQKATVNLDDVTLCLSKDEYRDILKLADNFASFNQRLKYAHYRPQVRVKADPVAWWKYAYKGVADQMKNSSGKLFWEQVLKYARLRKRYISLYVSLLKSDPSRLVVDNNKDIEELDRELDIEVILQWRMLAHKFLKQTESDLYMKKPKTKKSWWSLGWGGPSSKNGDESRNFSEEDWERLSKIIGYKEGVDEQLLPNHDKGNLLDTLFKVHMGRNASKLLAEDQECLAELSCEGLDCSVKIYSETKIFDLKLSSYCLSSPNGLLAKSAADDESLVGVFSYKPFDAQVDWSLVGKASPCYITYLKDSIDQIINFFESSSAISQTIALETAAAVQMTIDEVKRTAQQQVTRALKDRARFFLDLDIAAPKITIPTEFRPDDSRATKLLLDLGNFTLCTQDDSEVDSLEERDLYLQFNLGLKDISAFLVDGDYHWGQSYPDISSSSPQRETFHFLPVIDKCGVVLKLQQIRVEHPQYPPTRLSVRVPSLGFHFSPARYHRLMQVAKLFQNEDSADLNRIRPWHQADFEGWLSLLAWKGVGNREAVWQRRYFCLVGPFLYILESPASKTYKQYLSLRGKQVLHVPAELAGNVEHVLAICDVGQSNVKVADLVNALVVRCDSDDSRRTWQSQFQRAIYRASASAAIASLSEISDDSQDSGDQSVDSTSLDLFRHEKLFLTGVLDELRVRFSCDHRRNKSFKKILLAKESVLLEFRAIGGQVELSIRSNDMFIGTVLKSLEVEDLFGRQGVNLPRFLARSFIGNRDDASTNGSFVGGGRSYSNTGLNQSDCDDNFFEASENLADLNESGSLSDYFSAQSLLPSDRLSVKLPSFSRISGLLPDTEPQTRRVESETTEILDSFVKAQIVFYDQDSPSYQNIDKQVTVTLATLSFFCHRPTILAILEFVNDISVEERNIDALVLDSGTPMAIQDASREDFADDSSVGMHQEAVAKGLLGKGKSRVIFALTLNMARAQILLMNENGTKLATLSQNNLHTDIKVFPSSFGVKAALGNLKISDDSLNISHLYYWICDMRNPGGSSFVELEFSSFSIDDEDYRGYDYSLIGQLSEVRLVYLNRFVEELVSYFMGLVPSNPKNVVKLKDNVTNSEKWFPASEIDGSPALKLDLSLLKPIILMPRRTDSLDYLELDVLHITVQSKFEWLGGDKNEMGAIHLEILTLQVKDINLAVGSGMKSGDSIIQDIKGLSVVIQRSLRDLLHQIPSIEIAVKIDELKAALSNREYQIITECATSNISEVPNHIPPLDDGVENSSDDEVEQPLPHQSLEVVGQESQNAEGWTALKISVSIGLVELSLHFGVSRDAALATLQISGAWLLYKSSSLGDGLLLATLKGVSVIDDREGTQQEFRLAIGKPESINYTLHYVNDDEWHHDKNNSKIYDSRPVLTMLILDVKISKSSTTVSLCVQRPQLLVALDFLLATVEFFVPTVRSMLSNEEDYSPLDIIGAITLDQPVYAQPSAEFSLSPRRPLVVDDDKFDHFVYDGKGGNLYLQDRHQVNLCGPSTEAIIFVGNGKSLQFKNVFIKNGEYLDSCILLGANSSYSASEDDNVFLERIRGNEGDMQKVERTESEPAPDVAGDGSTMEYIIELQAIGPELTFYNTSKDVGESAMLSNKLLHAQLNAFSRIVLKGGTIEVAASVLGLTMESNGVSILEPFDTSINFSSSSGKTKIQFAVSEVFMNFSFSILRLFLAVEEDILAFLRMTSKKVTVVCSQFDRVGTIQSVQSNQTCSFWRPRAPPGFAVLGDCLTPLNEPPRKGVLAINTSFARVKRPVSFELVWPSLASNEISDAQVVTSHRHSSGRVAQYHNDSVEENNCSIWFPIAPEGYVSLGCVVSTGRTQPSLSSALCIMASLVSPCGLKDCITLNLTERNSSNLALWRVDNSIESFLPADPRSMSLMGKARELRHMIFGYWEGSSEPFKSSNAQDNPLDDRDRALQLERSVAVSSGRRFETVASFRLVWWNQGTRSRKNLSIWRPVVPHGMVYLGDIAVPGYEPPNASVVLYDTGDDSILKAPLDFQLVGHIKKQRGMESTSFWLPQAPPGFVALGCIASKNAPKLDDFSSLRCIRSDMVTGGQFPEESIWDSSDTKTASEPFSIWTVGNEAGTFLVRTGFRKPPKRFALRLVDPNISSQSDDTIINAEIKAFSAALFDDYGGLMVPLFNFSLSGITFSFHGGPSIMNSTVGFSLIANSYNDKYDSWEPVVEPMDGFLRYQYDLNTPGAASQLRVTSTRDLNLNISVANANMILQAYSSWNNLSQVHESYKKTEAISPSNDGRSIIGIHHRKNYYIIPQNKLGRDIFMRASNMREIFRLPSGDNISVKVPVSKNMLGSHMKDNPSMSSRTMVTVIIADAKLPTVEGLTTHQYTATVRLFPEQSDRNDSLLQQQSTRTCGVIPEQCLPSGIALVNWSETFFFIVNPLENYMLELIVCDMGKGVPVGFFKGPLRQIASIRRRNADSPDSNHGLQWIELTAEENMMLEGDKYEKSHGRIRCAILMAANSETENDKLAKSDGIKPGFIQISPTREGPWTTVRLNYAAPVASWRLGNDVVASEVSVKDGDRFVTIRSLVSVSNHTDFLIDLRLISKASYEKIKQENGNSRNEDKIFEDNRFETEEFFEIEKYNPSTDWERCCPHLLPSNQCDRCNTVGSNSSQGFLHTELLAGWEWVDDWHVDCTSVNSVDGWLYASDLANPQWSSSSSDVNALNYARKRRWVRNRKHISGDGKHQISVGLLKPGEIVSLPLSGLTHTGLLYIFQLRPKNPGEPTEYSWSLLRDIHAELEDSSNPTEIDNICLSTLSESEKLLYCSLPSESSSKVVRGLWFCLSIAATVIGKDIHSDPIQDWNIGISSPLSIVNFLPMSAEFSVLEKQPRGEFAVCSRGIFHPGETIKLYNADLRNPLYFSLLPQGGWLPIHEAVLISHPSRAPSKTIGLRSSFSGRVVQVILDQNFDGKQVVAKVLRVYAPYWVDCARCPPLTYRLVDISVRRGLTDRGIFSFPFYTKKGTEKILGEITEEEILEGYTIDSMFNFNLVGLSVAMNQSGEGSYGSIADLSPLGGVDSSIDIKAYDVDHNCFRLFVSSKPCPYQSIPTKVISVRPFMTFTNRLGEGIFIKLSSEDQPKTLHTYDSRASFTYREVEGPEKLQVRLEDTKWCFPVEIVKEDTITMVLRKNDGGWRFLRTEIRGFEEGSRFLIVFRLGSSDGPIRIENRTVGKTISIRQSGIGDDAWIQLRPFSTTNFAWEDPYGQRLLDVKVNNGSNISIHKFSLDKGGENLNEHALNIQLNVVEVGDIKFARFSDFAISSEPNSHERKEPVQSIGNWGTSSMQSKIQSSATPMEFIVELGVVGVSLIDHRPRELLYLYMETVFVTYSTGYDGGTTSRFKLILGYLQLDNQLPLTLMPVLLAPEQHAVDKHHPVFKMTLTMRNEDIDGTLVYPYVYIRVTDKYWRISIHEPIIWALMDFYNNLRIDRVSGNSNVAQVDPEIRVDLIDVSEVRLKIALETAPTERPHGVLGVWSPILSAVGNALKIQIHLRKIMHKNRFMRKSKVIPSIVNRIWRDLIHNPLHLFFSVDVLGMTSSTLASLSKGFAQLSTDGQFLQLRSKQVSRRVTGVSDGFLQGTEALAQGVAFGLSGVMKKPIESARQHGVLGFAHGLGRAFVGFIAQPVSGALDFFSLTMDGIGASCTRCLEVFNNKTTSQRIRYPRAIHADGVLREYNEREAIGQMVLHLAEASRQFGCTEIFKEPSKYAWSDFYEDLFFVPHKKILLITNKRVMLLQCSEPDKIDKKPCKIMWDVPWEELLALELAKAGHPKPTHLILHLKNFKRSENFVRVVKCNAEEEEGVEESQAVRICLVVRKIWKAYQSDMESLNLKVPSSYRLVHLAEGDGGSSRNQLKPLIRPRDLPSASSLSDERKFVKHTINFQKIWSSERNPKDRFTLCPKQAVGDDRICSIWTPICPDGYISVGDIARVGIHPPNVAAVYRNVDGQLALPVGYDLVWRNCADDYASPVSIWYPRPPEGYVSIGCVAVRDFSEPQSNSAYCVSESLAEETVFEEQMVWSELESYPWACYIYQVQSEALHFVALRQPKEDSEWKPTRVSDRQPQEVTQL